MSEGTTEGTAFFSVQNDFGQTVRDFEALDAAVARSLGQIRGQFSSFQGVEFNPLDKVAEKVNQQAGLIERRLQDLFRKYENFARSGQTPAQPFSLAAKEVVTRGAQQVDRTVVGQAPNLGDADLALLRRTLVQALADGGTAAARALQSQLRSVAKDAGRDATAVAGSSNSLRAATVAAPVLRDVPETQSATDYMAATKAATKARRDAARASSDAATADQQAAKASTDTAARSRAKSATPEPAPKATPLAPESAPSASQTRADADEAAARAALDAAAANEGAAARESADRESATRLQAARSALATAMAAAARRVQESPAPTQPTTPTARPAVPPPTATVPTASAPAAPTAPATEPVRSDPGLAEAQQRAAAAMERAAASAAAAAAASEQARHAALDAAKADTESAAAARELANVRRSAARIAQLAAAADAQAADEARRALTTIAPRPAATPPSASPAPPAPPAPPTPPPPPTGGGGSVPPGEDPGEAGRRAGEEIVNAAEQFEAEFLRGLQERLRSGQARFVNQGSSIFDPAGELNQGGDAPIINARSLQPEPPLVSDRLMQQVDEEMRQVNAKVAALEARVTSGQLVALNARVATQPLSAPDQTRTFVDRSTGAAVDNDQLLAQATRLLADARRKAAADTQAANARALLEQRISSGDLVALNSRFATRPPTQPEIRTVAAGEAPPVDTRRTEIFDRTTGEVVDDEAQVERALQLLADVYRKAAASDLSELIAEAQERVRRELLALAEDVAAKRRAGQGPETDTGVQFGTGNTVIDSRRSGTPSVVQVTANDVQQLDVDRDATAAKSIRATQERVATAETARYAQVEREAQAAMRDRSNAERAASRTGVGNNFLAGLTSGGFGGDGERGLDGLARAAGQTAKYSTLYSALNLLRQGLDATIQGFLDANDSITEYEVAAGKGSQVTADFQNNLQSIAELSGFNVGEALDVSAKGVRAFGDEIDKTSEQGQASLKRLGEGFAEQATRLATLSKTTLEDAAGNLTAVAAGFELPKNNAGFTQVTDAIAGAKLAGGGDETQVFQGLASAAITFKNLGFSLNESATILSKINSQTDESGQLIATRVSRLSSILSGNAAGSFIDSLNKQLGPDQQIDRSDSQRNQLLKIADAYNRMSTAQQGALISHLGGTAEERELTVLLKDLRQITDEASKIKPGAGLEEYQKRLENVRAQLNEIKGFVQSIIVNLTTSGLADPLIELVGALSFALKALAELTRGFKSLSDAVSFSIGGANVNIAALVSHVVALVVALKGVQAVRSNGGVRGILARGEEVALPARALARQQLAGASPAATPAATTTPATGTIGGALATGRAAAAIARADLAAGTNTGVAGDADVRAAGQRVRQAAERLARAEEEQAAVIARQTEERRTFRADIGSNGSDLRRLTDRHDTERLDAAQAGTSAQLDLAAAQAELARAERVQARQAEVNAQFDSRRQVLTDKYQKRIGDVQEFGTRAFERGDTKALQVAMRQEAELREDFNVKLGALEAQRLVAEQRGAVVANASRTSRLADAVSFGGVGAARVARDEGAGLARTAAAFSGTAIKGIGSGIASLAKTFGTGGIILALADFGFQVAGASSEISKARQDLRDTNQAFLSKPDLTVQGLASHAASESAASQNLKEASGGFTGAIADQFLNGGGGERDAHVAEQNAAAFTRAAQTLADAETTLRSTQSPAAAAASTLDFSDQQKLKESFDGLQSAGYNASQSVQLLITRIGQLRFAASGADLTADERSKIATSAGAVGSQAIAELPPAPAQRRTQFVAGGYGLTQQQVDVDPAAAIDATAIQDRVTKTVTQQLARGLDVTTSQGSNQLEAALVKGYSDLVPDQQQAAALAHQIAQYVYDQAKHFATQVNSMADLQNLVTQGITGADAAASRTTSQAQLKALTSGTRDDSALTGANTKLAILQQLKDSAESKLAELKAAGLGEDKGTENDLIALNDAITQARIQQMQAMIADVQQQLQVNQRIRQSKQANAKTKAQIAAIGKGAFKQDVKLALSTGDIGTILGVFQDASRTQINAVISELEDTRAAIRAKVAVHQHTLQVIAAARAQMNVLGTAGFSGSISNALQGVAAAAQYAVGSAAGSVLDDQIKAAKAAAGQAVVPETGGNYLTGEDALSKAGKNKKVKDGPTQAQIAAAFAQANAVKDRSSTEVAQAAVQAAKADLAAAKDQQSKAQALQQLYAAENTLRDTLAGVSVARKYVNINPNDSIANARKAVDEARVELGKYARGTLEYYQALAQLHAAQQTLSDALGSLAVAKRFVNSFSDSQVQTATKGLAEARVELKKYAKGSLEYYQALAGLVQAQRELANANTAAYFLKAKLTTDLTDPVAQARLAVREAQAKLNQLRKQGAPADLINQSKLDLRNAQDQSESAAFSQRLQDAQTNEQLGRISHEAYLRYLQNEHNRLTTIRKKTRQQQDELNQIDLAIKAANDQFSGQFNIGDIKVPTIYEVRRAIANQTGKESVVANSQVNNTTHNQVTINGADFQRVVEYLKSIIGPQGASRITPIPRKG